MSESAVATVPEIPEDIKRLNVYIERANRLQVLDNQLQAITLILSRSIITEGEAARMREEIHSDIRHAFGLGVIRVVR